MVELKLLRKESKQLRADKVILGKTVAWFASRRLDDLMILYLMLHATYGTEHDVDAVRAEQNWSSPY